MVQPVIKVINQTYLEVHELHELGHLGLQHLHSLLVDLHSVGLLVAFHLTNAGWCCHTDSLYVCTRAL